MKDAMEIMKLDHCLIQMRDRHFKVRSQSGSWQYYDVVGTGKGLVCSCYDHQNRKADCKHIKVVLEKLKRNETEISNTPYRIMDLSSLNLLCKDCDSGNVRKSGMRKNKNGSVQRFECTDCGKKFTVTDGFAKRRYDSKIITHALELYFRGMSVRDIASSFEKMGVQVSFKTVYNWIAHYSDIISEYLEGIVPRTGDMVRADEVWIKVGGEQKYLFASMDDDTRFWIASDMAHSKFRHNADSLLKITKEVIGKSPIHFVTDGLPAYKKSSKRIFGKETNHHRHIHLRRDMNNNKMERLNGEIRDREKVFRGLKKFDTPILDGMKVYYNYAKSHGGLGGKTPAEAARIRVEGKDKWHTLIQNSAKGL